ncbi:MAG: MBL fold metallo-hydrolase [Pseudomonadota bacterium]
MIRLTLALILVASTGFAKDRRPSHCIALADATPGMEYIQQASFTEPVSDFSVRLHYVDHATFLIQTPGGHSVATDYAGFLGATTFLPEVVTMNIAHETHWTAFPDPGIPHVLEGWGTAEAPRDHHLELSDLLVRNVHTDIRNRFTGEPRVNGNSIFVFEVEGLCIAHLGHLHHEPDVNQYAALGRIDVVMVPVDGGFTMDQASMISVLQRLRSSVVIPMHWFGLSNLERFLDGMEAAFAIERRDSPSLEVSLRSLPDRPTVIVLQPEWLSDAPQ